MLRNASVLRHGFILFAIGLSSVFCMQPVSSQNDEAITPKAGLPVSITAKSRGFPRANFEDGKDLPSKSAGNQSPDSQKLLTSADFDSDGTADLITVDISGTIRFYRGNVDSIYPNSPEAAARKATATSTDAAFFQNSKIAILPISPDYFKSGDFNADGYQDIVAAGTGESSLYFLAGNGRGNLSQPNEIALDSSITGLNSGEIGRPDGQTDVAVVTGSKLLLFERPEGAFSGPPETIKLNAPADIVAVGQLNDDGFGDVVTAGGSRLTIVYGRGQVSPWDKIKGSGIVRPTPTTDSVSMPFRIAGLEIGYFADKRGQSLAILTSGGEIRTLASPVPAPQRGAFKASQIGEFAGPVPKTGSKRFTQYRKYAEDVIPISDEIEALGLDEQIPAGTTSLEKHLADQAEKRAKALGKLSPEERANRKKREILESEEAKQRTHEGFIRAISPAKTEPLSRWLLESVTQDSRLASAAASFSKTKIVKVRVSDSGRDELAFVDSAANQIHLLLRENPKRSRNPNVNEIVSLDSVSSPLALLPMRLNEDAVSDLIILREGAQTPSVVMTAPSATFVVTTVADEDDGSCGSSCSLREAIDAANSSVGVDAISFSIGSGTQTLQPLTNLPNIDFGVTIDGTTQPGFGGIPLIEINGDSGEDGDSGLSVNAANCVIRGFAVNGFRRDQPDPADPSIGGFGITIFNFAGDTFASFNIVEGNNLGTDPSGNFDVGNESAGLQIFDSDNNNVGGTVTAARNIMSGNGNGDIAHGDRQAAGLLVVASNFTLIQGNYVGLGVNGNTAVGNSDGISISGANNVVGGDGFGAGNTVSGNRHSIPYGGNPFWCGGRGISEDSVIDQTTGIFLTRDSNYKGNRIGTNVAGNAAVGNCSTGFFTSPRNMAIVGSITPSGRNTVSGNTNGGLFCSIFAPFEIAPISPGRKVAVGPTVPEGYCRIVGNNVGTDTFGNIAIPNNHDVFQLPNFGAMIFLNVFGGIGVYNTNTLSDVGGSSGTSPGSCTGFCNLVAGTGGTNTQALLFDELPGINRAGRNGEVGIFKNYVGTNISGTSALPNKQGIRLYIAAATRVGSSSLGNLISGNTALNPQNSYGIRGSVSNIPLVLYIIRGNLIGTDRTGINALPNGNGMLLSGDSGAAIIGGTDATARNIVSGNTGTGIILTDLPSVPTVNNYIGVNINGDPLGNGGNGVELRGDFDYFGDNSVGNVIANNGQTGVLIILSGNGYSTSNRLRFNSIYNNGALGIDLSADNTLPYEADGVTPNDCDDADVGSNGLQNYPILTTPVFNGDGTVTVSGALGSAPSQTFTLDFYSNTSVDPSDYGEGETHIGSTSVTTDASGKTAFQFSSTAQVAQGLKITATATDSNNNTSEFSCFAGQCVVRLAGLTEEESVMEMIAPGCEIGFVVNINTDQPDTNPADGICDVDLVTTGQQCSLRAAIQTTNAIAGTDFISFDIPGGGLQTISPTSQLPPITENVYMNAATQPGYAGTPLVELNGSGTSITSNGLVFAAGSDGSNVIALTINRFGDSGILIDANDVEVSKSYIGVFADGIGIDPAGRQRRGIMITGARNKIGGIRDAAEPSTGANNVIAGNSIEEIKIVGTASVDNTLVGNAIGFTLADNPRNQIDVALGIVLDTGSSRTTVGGIEILSRNLIQGNTGIWIFESDDNIVLNNGIANSAVGVAINRGKNNTIGGAVLSGNGYTDRNLIVNNLWGVYLSDQPDAPASSLREPLAGTIDCSTAFRSLSRPKISSAPGVVETTGNKIQGNLIGIRQDSDPIGDFSNCLGVVIDMASGNFVGSSVQGFSNFISGNVLGGVAILKDGTGNEIRRNFIGTKRTGLEAYPNFSGVIIAGNQNKVIDNVISGNSEVGVQIGKRVVSDPVPDANVIMTNKIGLGVNDTSVANTVGIEVQGTATNISGNTISGNTDSGLLIQDDMNAISNNFIGTDTTGSNCRPNVLIGMRIFSSNNNVSGNVISCNLGGVVISSDQGNPARIGASNTLKGNLIGTNATGTIALSGQEVGIALLNGASNNLIGGLTGGARNIISGNTIAGIELQTGLMVGATPPTMNTIQGNFIGTNANGTAAIPNQSIGVDVDGASQTLIGGFGADMPGARNVVSGNGDSGIRMIRGALATRISGNFIGTQADGISPLGNVGNGIRLGVNTTGTIIGGPEPSAGNTIAFNGANGITASADAGNNNIIDPNSIFSNVLLGIDLGDDGNTPNDPSDADTGPNNLQNYPEIVSKQIVANELIIDFKVDSAPENSAYGTNGIYVEFFKADMSGEGERFIGFTYYTLADYNSLVPGVKTVNLGDITTLGITPGDPISATATDENGNTSEFTPTLAPTAAAVSISGRVLTTIGTGLWNAVVTLTDQAGNVRQARSNTFGYFNFEDLEAGQIVIIQVRSKEYQFEPHVISVLEDINGLEISPGGK